MLLAPSQSAFQKQGEIALFDECVLTIKAQLTGNTDDVCLPPFDFQVVANWRFVNRQFDGISLFPDSQ